MSTRWGRRKPPLGAQINWAHPLAQGLSGCWLFNEGATPSDIARFGKYPKAWTTPPLPRLDGLKFNGIDQKFDIDYYRVGGQVPIALVVFASWAQLTDATLRPAIQQGTEIVIGKNNSADFRFVLNSLTGANDRASCSTGSVDLNRPSQIAGTYTPTELAIWTNGIKRASVSPSGSYASLTTDWLFGTGSGSGFFSGVMHAAYIYAGNFSSELAAWLNTEPYAFIQPPQPWRKYFGPTVASSFNPAWAGSATHIVGVTNA